MYLTVEEAMSLLCSLAEVKKMKVAFKRRKGYTFGVTSTGSGVGAFVGSLVGGPVGLAVGGTIGGFLGALMTRGKIKPLSQILKELPADEKKKLHRKVVDLIRNRYWKDITQLIEEVKDDKTLQDCLRALLVGYVTKELGATVRCSN